LYRPIEGASTSSTTAHNNAKSKVSGLGQHSPVYQQHLYVETYQSTLIDPAERAAYKVQVLGQNDTQPLTNHATICLSNGTPPPHQPPAPPVFTQEGEPPKEPNTATDIADPIADTQHRPLNMGTNATFSVHLGAATCPETYRGNGELCTVTSKVQDAQGSMNTENLMDIDFKQEDQLAFARMDIDFKQEDQLAFARGGVQPKPRMVSSVKLNWNGTTGDK
jgi:hypothetical protein